MGGKLLNLVKTVMRRHNILWSGRKEPPMHYGRRSDLALEAKELFESSAGKTTQLSGVRAREETLFGYPLTRVDILDETGAEALGKPVGTYLTLEFPALPQGREELLRAARAVAALLGQLPGLPDTGPVFVAGLGNRQMTPDAIGPKTTDLLLITRHLVENLPEEFSGFRPVAALAPGVTGTTGVETGELLAGVLQTIRPACLIAVDALAARRQERVCRTIQVSNTGIVPGSGVGNARMALDEEHLGLPVLAVGVPTVVGRGPCVWICWKRPDRIERDQNPRDSLGRVLPGSSHRGTSTAKWRSYPRYWGWGSAQPCMWTFPWKMWKTWWDNAPKQATREQKARKQSTNQLFCVDTGHLNFRLSPTASSSQRLLYTFSACPFTQWYVS